MKLIKSSLPHLANIIIRLRVGISRLKDLLTLGEVRHNYAYADVAGQPLNPSTKAAYELLRQRHLLATLEKSVCAPWAHASWRATLSGPNDEHLLLNTFCYTYLLGEGWLFT